MEAVFLGETKVVYQTGEKKDYIPGEYSITECTLDYGNGKVMTVAQPVIRGKLAEDVRDGAVREIRVTLS